MKNIKFKISNFNKYLIFLIVFLFLYLFYLSIPSLYEKGKLQKDLSDKLLSEFNINASFSADLNYSILPSPQIIIKDAKIFNNSKENPKELAEVKKMRIIISQKRLVNQDNLEIKKIIIQDANFLVQRDDFKFYNDFISKKFSPKNIIIKNSNFFYKNYKNETISIFLIDNLKLFYDSKKLVNDIISKGKVFKLKFELNFNKNFVENPYSETLITLNDIKLKFKNKSIKKNNVYFATNDLEIRNFKTSSKYQFENNLLSLKSFGSKLKNNFLDYEGKVNLNPFYLELDIDLEKIDLKKLFIQNSIIKEFFKTNIIFNKNISANLSLTSNNLIRTKIFDKLNLFLNINNEMININNTYFTSDKIGILKVNNSSLSLDKDEATFKSRFNFNVKNEKEFFKAFQVPKKNRMDLRNIFFEIEYNFFKNQIKINYFNINNKEDLINQETQSILDEFNRDDSDGIKNWIDFKKITNRLLESQSG